MKPITRRAFLKNSLTTGAALVSVPWATGQVLSSGPSPNGSIRLGLIGLGGLNVVGGVGGRGRQLMATLQKIPEARIVALCDVDRSVLADGVRRCEAHGHKVETYSDLRRLLDNQSIDAVLVATPNHWHALATVWACQAGKDVYVEKPFSYTIWEGRQAVAAARKYKRIVQVGTQNRSSELFRETFASLRNGEYGAIRSAHALVYRPRESLGRVDGPTPIPSDVDYELWCGPSPKGPLMRKQLHYEWHWFWATGNGEMGNNGIHVIDICRWALGMKDTPSRALSLGGRFAFNDCGETPNTQVAFFDYQPAPLICEVRNVRAAEGTDAAGKFRHLDSGVVIGCENAYLAGDANGLTVFDRSGATIKKLPSFDGKNLEVQHMRAFLKAVRSRRPSDLAAEALEGQISTACCHLANISYRVGHTAAPEAILEQVRAKPELQDAYERCREHLGANGVDLGATPMVMGAALSFNPEQEQFTGEFAEQANPLLRREGRAPFLMPEVARG